MAKIKFTTTIDDEILRYLKIQSASEGISVGTLIEKMFDQYPEKISISIPIAQKSSFVTNVEVKQKVPIHHRSTVSIIKKDGTVSPPEEI